MTGTREPTAPGSKRYQAEAPSAEDTGLPPHSAVETYAGSMSITSSLLLLAGALLYHGALSIHGEWLFASAFAAILASALVRIASRRSLRMRLVAQGARLGLGTQDAYARAARLMSRAQEDALRMAETIGQPQGETPFREGSASAPASVERLTEQVAYEVARQREPAAASRPESTL